MNKNQKETKETNNKKVKVKFPEVQSEGLLQIKEQANKRKTYGFYSNMSNEELLEYGKDFCKKNKITKRIELQKYDGSLYRALRKSELLDFIFGPPEKKPPGFYSNMSDEELIDYSKKYCKENKITKRFELETKNKNLYERLRIRNLLDSVFGQNESKPCGFYSNMSDEELIAEGRKYCEENINTKRSELKTKNSGLHQQLWKRNLLDSVFGQNESKPCGFYSNMSDNELLKYCEEYCKKNNITKRNQLISNNISLYNALRKRKFLNSVFGPLEKKSHGFFSKKTDDELVEYVQEYCDKNHITKRNELQTKNKSLYEILRRRNLLDSVFPEQSHLNDLVDAIRNFGDGENE